MHALTVRRSPQQAQWRPLHVEPTRLSVLYKSKKRSEFGYYKHYATQHIHVARHTTTSETPLPANMDAISLLSAKIS